MSENPVPARIVTHGATDCSYSSHCPARKICGRITDGWDIRAGAAKVQIDEDGDVDEALAIAYAEAARQWATWADGEEEPCTRQDNYFRGERSVTVYRVSSNTTLREY